MYPEGRDSPPPGLRLSGGYLLKQNVVYQQASPFVDKRQAVGILLTEKVSGIS